MIFSKSRSERITVSGAVEPSEGEVRTAMATEATSWWRRHTGLPIGQRHCLDSLELARDKERLHALHLQHGLFLAKTEYRVTAAGGSKVDIAWSIVEGPRTLLDSVRVRGLDSIPEARAAVGELLHDFGGEPFNEPELLAAIDSVHRLLKEIGYVRAPQPSLRLVRDTVHARAWLDVGFAPGRRVVIGAVELAIRPNAAATEPRIGEDAVRRRLSLALGGTPSPSVLLRNQRSLFELDSYSLVRLDTSAMGTTGDSMRVTVNLVESNTRSLRLGGGWATLDCFRMQARWVDRSLFGTARRVEIETRLSKIGRGAPLDFAPGACAPVVRDDPFSDRLNYFVGATTYITDLFGRKVTPQVTLYSESRSEVLAYRRDTPIGLRMQVSAPFPPFITGSAALSYEYGRTDADEAVACLVFGACTAAEVLQRQTGGSLAVLALGSTYDLTGGRIDPLIGVRLRLENRLGLAHLAGATGTFNRTLGDATIFRPLSPSVTLAAHVQLGVIGRLSSDAGTASAIPLSERFFLGGQNSVRGYGQNQLGDVLYVMTGADTVSYDAVTKTAEVVAKSTQGVRRLAPVGGEASFLANLELRVRAPRMLGSLSIAGFVDAGQLRRTAEELFRFDEVRVTPGVGVRLATAFGLFRVDIGYNPYSLTPGPAFIPVTSTVAGSGRLLCVSPGTTDRLVNGSVVKGAGDCPSSFAPPAASSPLSRLVFHFGIGQAF
ncbi:MAG: BamA/TamA family outer membrane protein [Gemmatimonadetes bacterium]|nr:BamA/TamA family outer membrane protein [Gemmatimonadota bacterium]